MPTKKKKRRTWKDVTPADLMVACDHFEGFAPPLTEDWLIYAKGKPSACYFKTHVPEALLSILQIYLPSRPARVLTRQWEYVHKGYTRLRSTATVDVRVFPLRAIKHVLKFVGLTAPSDYYATVRQTIR